MLLLPIMRRAVKGGRGGVTYTLILWALGVSQVAVVFWTAYTKKGAIDESTYPALLNLIDMRG